jgi:methionyl-tRNA formyltransferase
MQPWPTAYTYLHREGKEPLRVILSRAVEFPVRYDPAAGQGLLVTDPKFSGSLFVTAGLVNPDERSVVEVSEIQPDGKRRMPVAAFLRGNALSPGARMGPEAG